MVVCLIALFHFVQVDLLVAVGSSDRGAIDLLVMGFVIYRRVFQYKSL